MREIKVDSSVKVDRHALQSKARDDRETRNAQNLNTAQDSRISKETALRLFCDEKSLLCKASAEIRLMVYRTSEPQQSPILAKKPNPPPPFARVVSLCIWAPSPTPCDSPQARPTPYTKAIAS